MRPSIALLLCAGCAVVLTQTCNDLSCMDKSVLIEHLEQLREENDMLRRISGSGPVSLAKETKKPSRSIDSTRNTEKKRYAETSTTLNPSTGTPLYNPGTTSSPAPTCSICASQPCLNGGTCYVDVLAPWTNYTCQCPSNRNGKNCENLLSCSPFPCGVNADCAVGNNQLMCVCRPGYSGNPYEGCRQSTKQACVNADPSILTFDHMWVRYQGTCPIVFSKPCTSLSNGYENYEVRIRNQLTSAYSRASYVVEVEVDFYGQTVHLDSRSMKVYFNGFEISTPYSWPSIESRKISIAFTSGRFTVQNDQNILVRFGFNDLCLEVPNNASFTGANTLCGPAGNIDGTTSDDIKFINGTTAISSQFVYAIDTWATANFAPVFPYPGACVLGKTLVNGNTTNCNVNQTAQICAPIQDAAKGLGMFGMCQGLPYDEIMNYYTNCVNDLCIDVNLKCHSFEDFVSNCQLELPNVDVGNWRDGDEANCPLTCPYHSHYSSCKSSCPSTCADYSDHNCDRGCTEGCTCDPGYVVDTTDISSLHCIVVENCGCLDEHGSPHKADEPWLTNACTTWNDCVNGTQVTDVNECGQYASCGVLDGEMACVCRNGFQGDGYNCSDIDECADSSVCGQDQDHGVCVNSIGSYHCNCNTYWEGSNCQSYLPQRHCADLQIFHGQFENGVYDILPPGANQTSRVYCDFQTDGGGYTLMSGAVSSETLMSGKSLNEYRRGFGDPLSQSVWIGLDNLLQITQEHSTSLKLNLLQCGRGSRAPRFTTCTYPVFWLDNSRTYNVWIPHECVGNETDYSFYDGWVRWNKTEAGPPFSAFDSSNSYGSKCSNQSQNTGWWYYQDINDCGPADLNGVRTNCQTISNGGPTINSYLKWNDNPLEQVSMWLRPQDFPDYDPVGRATTAYTESTTSSGTTPGWWDYSTTGGTQRATPTTNWWDYSTTGGTQRATPTTNWWDYSTTGGTQRATTTTYWWDYSTTDGTQKATTNLATTDYPNTAQTFFPQDATANKIVPSKRLWVPIEPKAEDLPAVLVSLMEHTSHLENLRKGHKKQRRTPAKPFVNKKQ
ncbi:unnamed protein product [Caenorhabditis auriculariae]|uniref:Uncharacterized protein n=1 Tax=Caenorhabditis auriculariae TaxID=2777116 RepID=A0A8S1GVT3_9PELO|nr:unnamed protein product [Caenorhabditis auriculariae]